MCSCLIEFPAGDDRISVVAGIGVEVTGDDLRRCAEHDTLFAAWHLQNGTRCARPAAFSRPARAAGQEGSGRSSAGSQRNEAGLP
jgi:hypothetical protein